MEIRYAPPEGEPRAWQFVPRKLMSADAEAIEAVGGDLWEDFDEFARLFNKGNRRAMRAALWILLRQDDPGLRFDALSVGAMDVQVSLGEDERERIRDVLVSVPDLDPDQRAYFVSILGDDPGLDPKDETPSDSPEHTTA